MLARVQNDFDRRASRSAVIKFFLLISFTVHVALLFP